MRDLTTRVLFLDTGGAERVRLAVELLRKHDLDGIDAVPALLRGAAEDPEPGAEGSDGTRVRAVAELGTQLVDVVLALCDRAASECPVLPGNPEIVSIGLEELHHAPPSAAQLAACRDELEHFVHALLEHDLLAALVRAQRRSDLILNSISDGIIAHDANRRVFYFNDAACRITGYDRQEVINRDCHDVFPGAFCGPGCRFGDGAAPNGEPGPWEQEMEIVTKTGEQRIVELASRTMYDRSGDPAGLLASFRDVTRERQLARRLAEVQSFSGIIGRDEKMLEIFDLVRDLADSAVPVLLQGESGTGKELVAAAIHNEGVRSRGQFVAINCGALPEALLESELFGHVKGAFTGAFRDKKGRFELADGGTIFLDEIGDISPTMQVKLLRVLQEGAFERVGSEQTVKVDARVISASNKDLAAETAAGRFREDLYYRLSVVPIWLPPLRERRNDIPPLIKHILAEALAKNGHESVDLAPETLDLMISYDWPGNVRELQNWIQFALVKCKGDTILPEHLPPRQHATRHETRSGARHKLTAGAIREALRRSGGNRSKAATLLGVSRATFYRHLNALDEPL